jgi:hypothetical protein
MIKLIAVEPSAPRRLRLRFSDGAWGVFDFSGFIDADTVMTRPLADDAFFEKHFIEAGALAWPNGFDLSAASLYQRLDEAGELHRDANAA